MMWWEDYLNKSGYERETEAFLQALKDYGIDYSDGVIKREDMNMASKLGYLIFIYTYRTGMGGTYGSYRICQLDIERCENVLSFLGGAKNQHYWSELEQTTALKYYVNKRLEYLYKQLGDFRFLSI